MKRNETLLKYLKQRNMLVHLGVSEDETIEKLRRTSGEVICVECGKYHREHPFIDDVLDYDGGPFLHDICGQFLAKL